MHEHTTRRATLPGGVILRGTAMLGYSGWTAFHLKYRGTIDALLAAGCITPSLLAKRMENRRTEQSDEHGHRIWLQRSATKGSLERMELVRRAEDPETAKQLPGVIEMFPEYMPGAVKDELHAGVDDLDKDEQRLLLEAMRKIRSRSEPIRPRPALRFVVNNEFAGGCTP